MNTADLPQAPDQAISRIAETRLDRTDIEAILAKFTARNQLPALRFGDDGMTELSIAGEVDLALFLVPDFPGLMVAACLPEELAEHSDICRELLQANLGWAQAHGATFSKFPNDGPFALCRCIALATGDDRAFEQELLAFAEQAAEWIDEIELGLDLPADGGATPPAPPSASPIVYA